MTVTLQVPDAAAAALLERTAARIDEVRKATMAAPHGQAPAAGEAAALEAVFATGCDLLENVLAARVADAEKKGRRAAAAAAPTPAAKGRGRAASSPPSAP